MIDACVEVGVKRVVYVSHTQPSVDSDIAYIRAKALAEEYIREKIPSYGFIRPNCLFGDNPNESIVINNTCYLLKRSPLMIFPHQAINTHFQPVHVRDLVEMAVNLGLDDGPNKNRFVDAVGPEKFKFFDFVNMLKKNTNSWSLIHTNKMLNPSNVYQMTKSLNYVLNDIFIDDGELDILCQDLACSKLTTEEAKEQNLWGKRALSEWVENNKDELGNNYINTFQRYYDIKGKKNYKG